MKFLTFLLFLLSYGCHEALSQYTYKTTTTVCCTSYATTSTKSVPTTRKSYTYTNTYTYTSTSTPYSTVVPPPAKTTVTTTGRVTTTTTRPAVTNTYTTTSTVTTTNTITAPASTATATTITTSTVTSTSTVPFAPYFPPVQATLQGSSRKKRSTPRASLDKRQTPNSATALKNASKYPKNVQCSVVVKVWIIVVVKKTAPTKTVTARPSTSTITVGTTVTSTSTVVPPNTYSTITTTTTTTALTTTTPVTTTTTTITSTETTVVMETSSPCGPTNQASKVNGVQIFAESDVDDDSTYSLIFDGARTAEQCCQACFAVADCAASNFYAYTDGSSICEFRTAASGVCDPDSPFRRQTFTEASRDLEGNTLTVSNGKCGLYTVNNAR